jgi:AcrR family transcriptional regulator
VNIDNYINIVNYICGINFMNMDNKQIQEQRMKGYFIQATKEILKAEGLKSISVRNIAERAGYSYATLYNYFKDIKDLIFLCVKDFQCEIETSISEKTTGIIPGKERLKIISMGYLNYFLEYPGIFELFYLERMSDISSNTEATHLIVNFLNHLCEDDWKVIEQDNNAINLKKSELNYTITGLLLFYLNRREPASYQDFTDRANRQLEFIIE